MRRNHRALLAATFAALSLGSASTAKAEDWKVVGEFGWFGVGKALEVEKDHYYWVGEFSGTFFNDKGPGSLFHRASVRCPAWNDLNVAAGKGKAGGYCVLKDKDGDQATATWENVGNNQSGSGTFTFTAGTGKYKGITGTYPFVGVTQVNWADGSATGYSTWNR